MKSKQGAIECHICGALTQGERYLSYTGQCPECSAFGLTWNIRGLVDPGSVPYKTWKAAYEMRRPGRPRNTTPPPSWTPNSSVLIRYNTL